MSHRPRTAEGVSVALALNAVDLVADGAFVRLSSSVVLRRDIGGRHSVQANTLARSVRAATRLLAPPLLADARSLSFAAGVLLLAPEFDAVATALAALSIAVTVRAAAYYREGVSKTLATMFPFSVSSSRTAWWPGHRPPPATCFRACLGTGRWSSTASRHYRSVCKSAHA